MDGVPNPGIIDAHCHLYSEKVISSVLGLREKLSHLGLEFDRAGERTTRQSLLSSAEDNGVSACVVLFTARQEMISQANEDAVQLQQDPVPLFAAGTLHPEHPDVEGELHRLADAGVRGVKFSSFSQQIDFSDPISMRMLDQIQRFGAAVPGPISVVLDTFVGADQVFGAHRRYLTAPETVGRLVSRYPGINFIGAHLGGLTAQFDELMRYLEPAPNLYLDTSNAAHILTGEEMVAMLKRHGPDKILFGTDWPWFDHAGEIPRIRRLLEAAGFSESGEISVLRENAARLLLPLG